MSQQNYDLRTLKNISLLQPDFADRVRQWLRACRESGLNPLIHYTSRTPAEQQALHQKYLDHTGPKAVAPERSYHCYGRAFDWVNIKDPDAGESGLNWDDNEAYAQGVEIGKQLKIVGIGSDDNDHLQDGNYPSFTNLPPNEFGNFPKAGAAVVSTHQTPIALSAQPIPSIGENSGPLTNPLLAAVPTLQAIAMGLRAPLITGNSDSAATGAVQDTLDKVLTPQDQIQAGSARGIFGPKTKQAVMVFQSQSRVGVDGEVGRNTLRALDSALNGPSLPNPVNPSGDTGIETIVKLAADSAIRQYHWDNRGRAPIGYIKGMAVTYARVYGKLKKGDPVAVEAARADKNAPVTDALTHYREIYQAAGMSNSESGAETLRHLFVLMLGLGMRESSGSHCEGRDITNPSSNTADSAEAGLFQTSWNAHIASPLMPEVFQTYQIVPNSGFVDIFHEGVICSAADQAIIGAGTGAVFQKLSKSCPAFAAEFAALGLRNICRHWGPIIYRAAELRPEADDLFLKIQQLVDSPGFTSALL